MSVPREGSMRVDCNVSVRPMGEAELGTRCEIKNINSFRLIEKAINSMPGKSDRSKKK